MDTPVFLASGRPVATLYAVGRRKSRCLDELETMKTVALLLVSIAFISGCAESDRAFEPVAEVIQPNDVKVCECRLRSVGPHGESVPVCFDQFCEPCSDSCNAPIDGQWAWTCNSVASDFEEFANWWMCVEESQDAHP